MQGRRGLEAESTYSGLLMLSAKLTGAPMTTAFVPSCGCDEILGLDSEAAILRAAATPILLLAFCAFAWLTFSGKPGDSLRWCSAVLLFAIVTFKVFSPQYLIWLLPFVCTVQGRGADRVRLAFFAACVVTMLVFPIGWDSLQEQKTWSVLALNLRNGLLVYCCADLIRNRHSSRAVTTA
jgi:hypothetical protein